MRFDATWEFGLSMTQGLKRAADDAAELAAYVDATTHPILVRSALRSMADGYVLGHRRGMQWRMAAPDPERKGT